MGAGGGLSPYSFTYDSATDSYILSAHTCFPNLFTLTIPSSNEGKPVTSIGPSALAYCNTLEKVDIPSTITSIGANAFIDCVNLNALNFYGNQPVFGSNVFGLNSVNAKIYRIPGKNWNTYFIQGRPVELFYPENYVIKNQIRTGGLGKITLVQKESKYDPDATIYINKIEIADGQTLEENVKVAINNFVVGCKADGNWNAIESCCIFAGARTLNGGLVPLKGPNLSNNAFITSDYNRTTGLKGNGTTKYLNTNYFFNSNQSEDIHASIVFTERSSGIESAALGVRNTFGSSTLAMIFGNTVSSLTFALTSTIIGATIGTILESKLFGFKRDPSNGFLISYFGSDGAINSTLSFGPLSVDTSNSVLVFATRSSTTGAITARYNGRIFFYSVGRNVDLQKLNNRTNALMSVYSTLT